MELNASGIKTIDDNKEATYVMGGSSNKKDKNAKPIIRVDLLYKIFMLL
jgi:hypothetical protein